MQHAEAAMDQYCTKTPKGGAPLDGQHPAPWTCPWQTRWSSSSSRWPSMHRQQLSATTPRGTKPHCGSWERWACHLEKEQQLQLRHLNPTEPISFQPELNPSIQHPSILNRGFTSGISDFVSRFCLPLGTDHLAWSMPSLELEQHGTILPPSWTLGVVTKSANFHPTHPCCLMQPSHDMHS